MAIISITGDLGSGKSTVSALLRKHLDYSYVYTGAIQRQIAEKRGMDTTELNKYAETHPEIDEEIDSTFRSLDPQAGIIADSRLAWFFIPNSFKVYLKTSLMVSAARIAADKQRTGESYPDVTEAAHRILERKQSENKRYLELYHANCADLRQFDLVIDTSFVTPEKVADIMLAAFRAWCTNPGCQPLHLLSPRNLYPLMSYKKLPVWDTCTALTQVTSCNSFDFIIDGHYRVSNAVKSGQELLQVLFLNADSLYNAETTYRQHIKAIVNADFIHEWEEMHHFRFASWPEL